jgi:hypothetical protein
MFMRPESMGSLTNNSPTTLTSLESNAIHRRVKSIPHTLHVVEERFCTAMHLGHDRSLFRDLHIQAGLPE